MRRWWLVPALVLSVGFWTGVGASVEQRTTLHVTPEVSSADQPVHIGASGLAPRGLFTVGIRSVDAQGTPWASAASVRADRNGRIDLDRSRALSGSYRGVWGMGLVAAMRPARPPPAGAYFWGDQAAAFTVTVRAGGKTIAAARFQRSLSRRALRRAHASLEVDGLVGDYWAPAGATHRPGVLAFGGSEGGETSYFLGALLASEGYPTLSLAYFKEPGLPQTLSGIPLEYFAKALTWLASQPEVDPAELVALGGSRGSEAALLLGVHFPNLVHAVVASSPSNVAICSFPVCDGPAWTLGGKALPYTSQFDNPAPFDDPAAVIPVEQIQGPVFLDCGVLDVVWVSCAYARAIVQRLVANHARYAHTLAVFPRAGHSVDSLVPYEPGAFSFLDPASEQARERLWPKLLDFLAGLSPADA